jgi:CubicO group peptidase (beta-lactamase class C family)
VRPLVRLLSAAVLSGAAVPAVAGAQGPPAGFEARWAPVRQLFRTLLADEGVVGGSLAFFRGDTVLAHEVYGLADRAAGRAVDSATIYHWASVTKTLTGVAVMQLRDRGRLRLDDPAVRHVPELAAAHNPFGPMEAVTLRHLLSHSAGFRGPTWPWGGGEPWHPHEPAAWSQLVAMMPYTDVRFPPGSRYAYSNPGIVFLGRTIERLTGEDYETYVEKNLLRPLGMRASYFDLTPYHLRRHRSDSYDVVDGEPRANGLDFDTGITVSNGGLNAPVTDMLRYLRFLAGAPGLDADARAVLDRRSLEEMWRPLLPTAAGGADSVGLAFFIRHVNGLRLVGHTGSQKAFRSFVWIHPPSGAGVIAVLNTAPADDPRNPDDAGPAKPRIAHIFDRLLDAATRGVFPRDAAR